MDKPLAEPQKIRLGDLPKEVARLGFLVDSTVKSVREQEKEISIQAGRIVGELYKELLKRYADPGSSETLKALNRLCVRLVFLFYAEDAELFPKDAFWRFLKETPAKFLRGQLMKLFRVLDTPGGKRDPYLEPELCAFPYTNGGLFKGADESDILCSTTKSRNCSYDRQTLTGAKSRRRYSARSSNRLSTPLHAAPAEWSIRRSRTSTRSLIRSSSTTSPAA
jgi:hypothetical protein